MATNLQIQTSPAVIVTDAEMLALVQRAKRDILTTGQSYTIVGSRSFTFGDLAELNKMELMYQRRVLTAAGYGGTNVANHDSGDGNYNSDPLVPE